MFWSRVDMIASLWSLFSILRRSGSNWCILIALKRSRSMYRRRLYLGGQKNLWNITILSAGTFFDRRSMQQRLVKLPRTSRSFHEDYMKLLLSSASSLANTAMHPTSADRSRSRERLFIA
ncbi:hypothetical protein BDD12DRAFT_434828 [Trichophaea hybrida]|nr:hypothetical protein BDD12DRAFT_434828 [Trichophaea hybrida]